MQSPFRHAKRSARFGYTKRSALPGRVLASRTTPGVERWAGSVESARTAIYATLMLASIGIQTYARSACNNAHPAIAGMVSCTQAPHAEP